MGIAPRRSGRAGEKEKLSPPGIELKFFGSLVGNLYSAEW
jgi:hypothetical protein